MKRPASFGIVFNRERTHLLILQRRDVAVWTLPGGGIDDGETPEEAVIRELKEETGLTVAIERKVAVYSPINRLSSRTSTYECRVIGGTLQESDESNGVMFCPLNELPKNFFFIHREWLEDALKQQETVIERPLYSASYWNVVKQFLRHPFRVLRFALSNWLYSYK